LGTRKIVRGEGTGRWDQIFIKITPEPRPMGGVLYLMTFDKNLFPAEIFFSQFHLQDFEKRSEMWQVYS